nr:transglutaminase-like domain-containing protein [Rhizobium laguerreae]
MGIDPAPLDIPRPPERRSIGVCRHFTVLACAALKAQGVPARARCGFGMYSRPARASITGSPNIGTESAGSLRISRSTISSAPPCISISIPSTSRRANSSAPAKPGSAVAPAPPTPANSASSTSSVSGSSP